MHTPGSWLFSPVNDCAIAIVEDDGTSIFDITVGLHTTGQSALAANTALVAAAPDLLAALQLVYANAGESPEWIRSRIAPVIARATGGQ